MLIILSLEEPGRPLSKNLALFDGCYVLRLTPRFFVVSELVLASLDGTYAASHDYSANAEFLHCMEDC